MLKIVKQCGLFTALASVSFAAVCALTVNAAESEAGNLLKRKSVEETILEKLHASRPEINFSTPRPSMIKGLYQVQVPGGPVLYVTPEGDKFIAGEIFGIEPGGFARLEDPFVIEERKKIYASIDPKQAITFKPKGKTKAVVYVFTDADCGYCRKMHNEINAYQENGQEKPGYSDLGIEIRYLAYPRAGIPSSSADKLISAWCAKDKQAGITNVKNDQQMPSASCDNPVAAQFQMGGQVGVNATPTLFMPDGKLMPGYLPPEDLARSLGI